MNFNTRMHRIFLVNDPEKFSKIIEREESDLKLKFYLKYGEWLSILLEVFFIDENMSEDLKVKLRKGKIGLILDKDLEDYPMFSRIKYITFDVTYIGEEILHFKNECKRLLELSSKDESIKGLEKLIKVCDLALENKKEIYFLGE